jgi:diaminopimelate decarboxylase/acyl carrier protein
MMPYTDTDLIERFGSPLYVYDLDQVTAAARDLRAALPEGVELLYSLKANPHPELVAALRTSGCGPEISSTGELASALQAGFTGADCFYSGPGKTAEEIAAAITAGVRTFSVESLVDLRRVGQVSARRGVRAQCLVRINGSTSASTAGLRMTGTASQFGFDITTAAPSAADLSVPGVDVVGMHFFPLTNAASEDDLIAEIRGSVRAAAELVERWRLRPRILDLGGGFACPYATPGSRPQYPGLRAAVEEILAESFPGWRDDGIRVVFESGRYLIGESGRLLCTVMDVKQSRENRYVVLDTGVNHIGGLSGIGRLLPLVARPLDTEPGVSCEANPGRVSLVGPLCTPADIVSRSVDLDGHAPGQRLVIPNVGAYGVTASLLGFLSRPTPGEVVLSGGRAVSATRLELNRVALDEPTFEPKGADAMTAQEWDDRYEKVLLGVLPRLTNAGMDPETNLRAFGLDSMATVEILVRLEEAYGIHMPDELLEPDTFRTPAKLWTAVRERLTP